MPAPGKDLDAEGFPTATNTVEFGFEDGPATGGRRKKAEKQAKKAKPGSFGKQRCDAHPYPAPCMGKACIVLASKVLHIS